jgi:hypothetical protein
METIFTEGFYLNKVSDNAPAFIITNQSIDVKKAIAWLTANQHLADEKGYIRIVGKESKEGKRYFQVDTYKPKTDTPTPVATPVTAPEPKGIDMAEFANGAVNTDDIPF